MLVLKEGENSKVKIERFKEGDAFYWVYVVDCKFVITLVQQVQFVSNLYSLFVDFFSYLSEILIRGIVIPQIDVSIIKKIHLFYYLGVH